jgi:glycosyltransferase involved in cell wall biosynthesis
MTPRLTVTVVVPTRNSARTLERCLLSLRAQTHPCTVVVVDNFSADATQAIARRHADVLMIAGPERSAQRNLGAAAHPAALLGFVDSDMVLAPEVVEQAAAAIAAGHGAAIVPERSVGEGFWARVRGFERAFYTGSDGVEAPRFFAAGVLDATGGFDETLDAGEDWDLGRRAARLASVARVQAFIDHDEGRVRYLDACRKKGSYAEGIVRFAAKHRGAAWNSLLDRPYLRRPWKLLRRPHLGAGLLALKTGEATAVALRIAALRLRSRGAPSTSKRSDDAAA